MISTQDILNIVVSIAVVVFVGAFLYLAIIVVITLKSIKKLTDSLRSTTKNFMVIKEGFKVTLLSILGKLIDLSRGGEKNGKK